jgi:hypothetical protein
MQVGWSAWGAGFADKQALLIPAAHVHNVVFCLLQQQLLHH